VNVAWLVPAALVGVTLAALPLAIHLLVRQRVRTVAFPSLRFLRETQLAAWRRRRIEDAWLLIVRMSIIAMAAMALAGPVFQSNDRKTDYARRLSRAIIASDGAAPERLADLQKDVFRSMVVRRAEISDAIVDALRWLDEQPASSREIVITGSLRRGNVAESDLIHVPSGVGVRFVQEPGTGLTDFTMPVLALRNGSLVRVDRRVRLTIDATSILDGPPQPVDATLVRVTGADQPLAEAALRAALGAGVPWRDFETRVTIELPPNTPAALAADVVMRQLRDASPPPLVEPVAVTPEQLAAWSRPPGAPSATAPLADEGHRRWLWLLALSLLAAESWMRRRASSATTAAIVDANAA